MLDRFKKSSRLKLQRAVAEVLRDSDRQARIESENRHDQLLAELAANNGEMKRVLHELAEARGQVASVTERLEELEQRARRDISHALDIQATAESAQFVLDHMPKAPVFWHPHDTLRYGLEVVKVDGLALEFGVASGTTLKIISEALRPTGHEVWGFDVWTGLPEAWRTGFPAGEFAQQDVPSVPGAQLVSGLFEDTLPGFLAEHPGPVAFAHLDADLYSSTRTVLELLADRLVPGTVLMFDEYFNYPGWQDHEHRAWTEFATRTGLEFDYLAYTANHEQVVVRLRE
ncbi:class I SAM-dependent methyltransferase [Rhodococcus sp. TAF43]|uniref:class I SAM-dependent methyltransferase n=1 Tax=unclassified Rhodococcus (in: high G+C Gram-positive bacteria) TaxID=192944 RepID=UPI000E0BC80D|nr:MULTISPECIES: class I SAM-dependent methyltransferase [unclassified Rhodococcus (in: high G+C Gram-positive bacteria)]QKT09600.1 class I SAM-dependent methyltransferase [Rhodococcus sp. W8901]RDI17216.1 methyltransferase family protein [Rhodococcus sp. AG1013]